MERLDKLYEILLSNEPRKLIIENEDYIFKLIPELEISKGFNQNNPWHIYDVYEHILRVVEGVDKNIVLRLAALFHDVGKPFVYTEGKDGIGHFYLHWEKSNEIFNKFAKYYNIDENLRKQVSNLILFHDMDLDKMEEKDLRSIEEEFGPKQIKMLFELKRSDLLASSPNFTYMLDVYDEQEKQIKKYVNN